MKRRFALILLGILALVAVPACAAKGARNQTRVGALTVGEAVLALDQAEQTIARANLPGYGQVEQKAVGAKMLQVLHAARAYERAAAAWKANEPVPQQLADAKLGISRALDDLIVIVPAVEAVREPLFRAVNVLRAALTSGLAETSQAPVIRAQGLPTGITGLFALASMFAGLISSGRSTYDRIRAALKSEGATDEELATLDTQLGDAIAKREQQQTDN